MTRRQTALVWLLGLLLTVAGSAFGQEPKLVVGEIETGLIRWGDQQATFDITNPGETPKTAAVDVRIAFEGAYLNPVRAYRSHYKVGPGQTRTISQPFYVPGNFGQAELTLAVYDVIDTLDALLPYQKVVDQKFTLRFNLPDTLIAYFQEEIRVPPLVGPSADFDAEFPRLLLVLLAEGRSVSEIAAMAATDTAFVIGVADRLTADAYLARKPSSYTVNAAVINAAQARAARDLAEEVAEELAVMVERNLPPFKKTMDSLVTAGELPPNADDFADGGSVLYYTYPTVAALLLWQDLGQAFIYAGQPLITFDPSNYCDPRNTAYMYVVQGGNYYNGTHFYQQAYLQDNLVITFCDSVPQIDCPWSFDTDGEPRPVDSWAWNQADAPEPFVIDTIVVGKALSSLRAGASDLLRSAFDRLDQVLTQHGKGRYSPGKRHWFWNVVATRGLTKLIEKGVLTRHGNGSYRFESKLW
jgi:hypothetical protein